MGVVCEEGMAGGQVGGQEGVAEVGEETAKQTWSFGLTSLPRFNVPSAKAVLVPIW
jgi:hypothetical protein